MLDLQPRKERRMTHLPRWLNALRFIVAVCSLPVICSGWLLVTSAAEEEKTDKPAVKSRRNADNKDEEKNSDVENPFPRRIPAPELDGGIEWLNTSGEISLKDLRGKVVVLDFWTYCCINCMHVLPDLEYLEKKYEKEIVVIGVHSAKFDNEKESGNIRKAILRYEIAHPVVNDAKMTIWRKFGVNSWPTMALIDPEGYFCGAQPGEGNRELFDQVIEKVIVYHKAKGTLDETPLQFNLERHKVKPGPLKFPGKVLADEAGQRLFISDSNHNRIVIAGLDGQLQDVIGTGQMGKKDGGYDVAEFDHPQGMYLVDKTLYVADTENHMIRMVDLTQKTVSTLAGDGNQARTRDHDGKLTSPLNSPWDVYVLDGILYIAMAGPHQMWSHQLGSDSIQPYAGSGREDISNGTLSKSALAQPSGIASDGKSLFVVDSEGSAVRSITTFDPSLKHDNGDDNTLAVPIGEVETIVGQSDLPQGRSLFSFGDVDGAKNKVRLQHPLGLAYHDNRLYVADSYNHKLKLVDLKTRKCETWLGNGKPGAELDPVQLSEPAGLTIVGDTLFVADTNNHRILKVDLKTKVATEFTISGLTPPAEAEETVEAEAPTEGVAATQIQQVKPGQPLKATIGFKLPDGYKVNDQVPVKYSLQADKDQEVVAAELIGKRKPAELSDGKISLEIPVASQSGSAELTLSVTYGYCKDGKSGLCKLATSAWKIPVEISNDAKNTPLELTASPK